MLGGLPEGLHFLQCGLLQGLAARLQLRFNGIKALLEFRVRGTQRQFRIHTQVPGAIDYTDEADAAFQKFAQAGMHVVRSTEPIAAWPGIRVYDDHLRP